MQIYIGYDSKQPEASKVCEYSIRKHMPDAEIYHINRDELVNTNLWYRNDEDPHSTEFTYTRFLTPYLNGYRGLAMFVDSDFIFTETLHLLETEICVNYPEMDKAVYVCQHPEYTPKADTKFFGQKQIKFPRKNWSSLMVFDCSHPLTRQLRPDVVNTASPQYLHRLHWADEQIGNISLSWNFLCGEYVSYDVLPPKGIHFTNGGPFNNVHGQDFEELWYKLRDEMNEGD